MRGLNKIAKQTPFFSSGFIRPKESTYDSSTPVRYHSPAPPPATGKQVIQMGSSMPVVVVISMAYITYQPCCCYFRALEQNLARPCKSIPTMSLPAREHHVALFGLCFDSSQPKTNRVSVSTIYRYCRLTSVNFVP